MYWHRSTNSPRGVRTQIRFFAFRKSKMSELSVFNFDSQAIRTLTRNGEPWFVAADVCEVLAIGNPSLAVNGRADREGSGLDEDERGIAIVNTPSGEQGMLVINESGLYSLILTSRSRFLV